MTLFSRCDVIGKLFFSLPVSLVSQVVHSTGAVIVGLAKQIVSAASLQKQNSFVLHGRARHFLQI